MVCHADILTKTESTVRKGIDAGNRNRSYNAIFTCSQRVQQKQNVARVIEDTTEPHHKKTLFYDMCSQRRL